ncbi:MAG TPA: cation diffusion facilitator family transporter [Pyrinomonadaceae bacterium]|nr:cation diffusion facilitator family transporter [Pyrinomonadaceae bacterium]
MPRDHDHQEQVHRDEHEGPDHAHSGPGHSHVPKNFGAAFAIGTTLNFGFVVLEVVFGVYAHSLALVADAGHNMGDVLGLLLAWGASILARSAPTQRRTYGLRSSSILAALFNAIFLLVSVGAIAWEAIRRFGDPTDVAGKTVIWVSAVGIAINTATALMFMSGRKGDLNIRGAFMHMAADAGISAGVVIAGFAILLTGYHWIDPVVSLAISAIIIWGTWGLLRDSVNLALQAVPEGIDLAKVKDYLAALPHVTAVHDLHVWPMSTTETALTAHLVRDVDRCDSSVLEKCCKELHDRFEIQHATIQFETEDHNCDLAPESKV